MISVPTTEIPLRAALPLVRLSDSGRTSLGLAGSSFVVAGDHSAALLVTAAHVVSGEVDDGAGRGLGVAVYVPGSDYFDLVPVHRWHLESESDLAVGELSHPCLEGFQLLEGNPSRHHNVLTVEHSRSIQDDPTKTFVATLHPLLRKGYIVQERVGLYPAVPSAFVMELSYPALMGASGAPVLAEQSLCVIGVVIANLSRELLPSQVLTAFAEDGTKIEEIAFFMPNALAVRVEHVRGAIARADAAFA